jgi:hypothetical protein
MEALLLPLLLLLVLHDDDDDNDWDLNLKAQLLILEDDRLLHWTLKVPFEGWMEAVHVTL